MTPRPTLAHAALEVPPMKSVAIASTLVVAAQGVVLHTWTWGVSYGCLGRFNWTCGLQKADLLAHTLCLNN